MALKLPGTGVDGYGSFSYGMGPFGIAVESEAIRPLSPGVEEELALPRVTDFRFDLLVRRTSDDGTIIPEAEAGELDGVQPGGGSVSWTYNAAVKGGGSVTVADLGQDIDWLTTRIRPVALLEVVDIDQPVREWPLGVYLPAAPVEQWSETGRSWNVELLDKATLLEQDVVTDPNTGEPVTYSVPKGTNVIDTVKVLIEAIGESTSAILPANETLNGPQTWEVGTSRLQVINDLLDTIGYFSLWVDGRGQFRTSPYREPRQRVPLYEVLAPFTSTGLMLPEWTRDLDIYSVPNRVLLVAQGDGDEEGMTASAVNDDPDSPFSFYNRGQWITEVQTGVEAASQESLQRQADQRLVVASGVKGKIELSHPLLPDIKVNSTIQFKRGDLDALCTVATTEVPFDPLGTAKTTLHEVA